MVFSLIAWGGAAAVGSVSTLFNYNRENWLTDIGLRQSRTYQQQNIRLAEEGMFRDDIRDVLNLTITKLSNSLVVSTLKLALSAEMWVEGEFKATVSHYILNCFIVSTATGMMFYFISIAFSVYAVNQACYASTLLLTQFIRLPTSDLEVETAQAAPEEAAAAIERHPEEMLRIPFLFQSREARLMELKGADAHDPLALANAAVGNLPPIENLLSEGDGSPTASDLARTGRPPPARPNSIPTLLRARPTGDGGGNASSPAASAGSGDDQAVEQSQPLSADTVTRASRHMQLFLHFQEQYQSVEAYSHITATFGSINFIMGMCYFAMSTFYEKKAGDWAYGVSSLLFLTADLLLVKLELPFTSREYKIWALGVFAMGPLCMITCAVTSIRLVDCILIPTGYFMHFLWTLCMVYQAKADDKTHLPAKFGSRVVNDAVQRDALPQVIDPPEDEIQAVFSGSGIGAAIASGADMPAVGGTHGLRERRLQTLREKFRGQWQASHASLPWPLMAVGGLTSATMWLSCSIWAVCGAFNGLDFSDDYTPWQPRPESPDLSVAWPNPYVRPHALECGRDRGANISRALLATDYLIFGWSGDEAVAPETVACAGLESPIADVATVCRAGHCSINVLLQGPPPRLLDCATGESAELLQTAGSAERLTSFGGTGADEAVLWVAQRGRVVEYSWCEERHAWAPLWAVVEGTSPVLALGALGRDRLLLQQAGDAVPAVWDLRGGRPRPLNGVFEQRVLGVCAEARATPDDVQSSLGSLLVLLEGRDGRGPRVKRLAHPQ